MDYAIAIVGLLLLGIGLLLIKTLIEPEGLLRVLPYVLVGVGCGVFGHGAGNVISKKAIGSNIEIQKQIQINQNDERNISIANHAKAKTYDMMVFVFGALMISFALMQIDVIATLLLVFSYLFVIFYGIYYRFQYERKM